ncbi:PilZ domain-containing protein [Halobacteriovorax sp. GB3]|uniref:PilZ domain-containing protein n=1 Tax=Halobacteriovorax sp. GB3 TaxID=2719615 RepID=UPI0023628AD0|nr:PilZ domain-containing protein [Halobacteriovorax sp. GB3]MDD0852250.1 PilZ domain-containing protein [Halobacteriovorax sp. GB3]
MSDANKKHYFTTIKIDEADSFFKRAVEEKKIVSLWLKGQSQDDVEEYDLISYNDSDHTLIIEKRGGFLSKLTGSDLLYKEIFFRINFETINIFSYSTLKKTEDGKLIIRVMNDVYKSQKRSNYRLQANRHIKIQLKINGQVYDALDISAGGTSFMIDDVEKETYSKQSVHTNCRLRLNRYQFDIPQCKVMGVWEGTHPDGTLTGKIKLGIAFIDLPERIEEDLFREINGEARAEEIRKKLES